MQNKEELLAEIKRNALANKVPIIKDDGLSLLMQIILDNGCQDILEIGTAVGYSAIYMHQVGGSRITSLERDSEMFEQANKNIEAMGYSKDIRVIFADATEALNLVSDREYDLIFIDAAKGQYQRFFEIYQGLLKNNGVIVCDNMDFHGLVGTSSGIQSRSLRGLVRKLENFNNYLATNTDFVTEFHHLGDGLTVSKKIKKY